MIAERSQRLQLGSKSLSLGDATAVICSEREHLAGKAAALIRPLLARRDHVGRQPEQVRLPGGFAATHVTAVIGTGP